MSALVSEGISTGPGRNASLQDLVALLGDEYRRRVDVVVPMSRLRAEGGSS
jgi:hypothetical protein